MEEVRVLVVKLVEVFGVLGHHLIVLLDEAVRSIEEDLEARW